MSTPRATIPLLVQDVSMSDVLTIDTDGKPALRVALDGGGGGPDVVQDFGNSLTEVMSQNAMTEALKGSNINIGRNATGNGTNSLSIGNAAKTADSDDGVAIGYSSEARLSRCIAIRGFALANSSIAISGQVYGHSGIAIGQDTYVHDNNGIAIGKSANAGGKQSVALGALSRAPVDGTVSVGNTETQFTRRIVSVSDPVNAQDAATKKYVDDAIAAAIAALNP